MSSVDTRKCRTATVVFTRALAAAAAAAASAAATLTPALCISAVCHISRPYYLLLQHISQLAGDLHEPHLFPASAWSAPAAWAAHTSAHRLAALQPPHLRISYVAETLLSSNCSGSLLPPPLSAVQATDEDSHRLICRPRLHLIIAALPLATATTLIAVSCHSLIALQQLLLTNCLPVS